MDEAGIAQFIERWECSGAAERANYQLFLSELCDVIGVLHPEPATPDTTRHAYVFERVVDFEDGQGGQTTRFIDLYKRGCFILEAKQGSDPEIAAEESLSEAQKKLRAKIRRGTAKRGTPAWDQAMLRAKGQADQYVRALSREEGRPPFIAVVDVGHTIELYSEFSCTGGTYVPFPAIPPPFSCAAWSPCSPRMSGCSPRVRSRACSKVSGTPPNTLCRWSRNCGRR